MPPESAIGMLPLTSRDPAEPICHRGAEAISVGRFLGEAAALAAILPAGGAVVNAAVDRYLALLAFGAALCRGRTTLLGAARGGAPGFWRSLAARHPDAVVLADAALDTSLPVLRLDALRLDAAPAAAPAIPSRFVAAIAQTSGSTGEPVAHPKPWDALVAAAEAAAERFGLRAPDGAPASIVATVPSQHMYGFETTLMLPLFSAVAIHAGAGFFPADVLAALAAVPERRVLVTTPLHLRALLEDGRHPPPLAAVISATAPLSREIAAAVEARWDVPVLEIYGATEAGSMASRRTVFEDSWLPYRGVALRPGAAIVPGLGEVPLGDLLEPAGDGRMRLVGRVADLVKLGGKRGSLAELNRVLAGVEGVVDGVFVAPEDMATNPAARLSAIVVAPGRAPEQILAALRRNLDPVFLPRRVALVEALPRDAVGKLQRGALAALAEAGGHDGG
jgi:acyl-coenzyme A synthetase/AMP-(fatty) acid ligase